MSDYQQYSDYYKKYRKDRYEKNKKDGICTNCHKRPAEEGSLTCRECKDRRKANNARNYKESPEKLYAIRAGKRKWAKKTRAERIENHLCVKCGEPLPLERTQRMCIACAEKEATYKRECYKNKRQKEGSGNA